MQSVVVCVRRICGGGSRRAGCGAAAASVTCRARPGGEPGHGNPFDAVGTPTRLSLVRPPRRTALPGRDPDAALQLEPPPEVPLDGVVERTKAARVVFDERSDRVEVGRLVGLGVLGLDVIERAVDGMHIDAFGVDAVVEGEGLAWAQNDVYFDLVPFLQCPNTSGSKTSRCGGGSVR